MRRRDAAVSVALGLAVVSVGVCLLAWAAGYGNPPAAQVEAYRTYFQKPNWYGYPAFFVLLVPALRLSWIPFMDAWCRLKDTGVLKRAGHAAGEDTVQALMSYFGSRRAYAVLLAVATSAAINTLDIAPAYRAYTAANLQSQLAFVCRSRDFAGKWVFDAWPSLGIEGSPCKGAKPNPAILSVAGTRQALAPGARQLGFIAVLALQQFAIVVLAALAIWQLILHSWWFARFEKTTVARERGLNLELNPESPVHEFGLEHWNHALNNLYWAISPALIAPFLSRASVPNPALMAPGQKMFSIFIPLVVLAPMIATIIARQVRLPAVWERLQPHGPADPALYLQQRLWPLDQNWSSKLGIIVAFAGAGLVLGIELNHLVKL